MYVIKMEKDKSLTTTIKADIYQNEKNADTLVFLVPKFYENDNMSNCSMMLRYILPNGIGKSEELEMEPEPYNNDYYRYHLSVVTKLTSVPGEIELWLSAIDIDDNLVLKSGTAFVEILPTKNIVDYFSEEDMEQLDLLEAKVKALESNKADNMVFDKESSTIQLTANGSPIGNKITISAVSGSGVKDIDVSDDGELIVTYADGSVENLGAIKCSGGVVYVPHISDRKILTFTIEDKAGEIPDPVDLNPFDEWSNVDDSEVKTDYIWKSI